MAFSFSPEMMAKMGNVASSLRSGGQQQGDGQGHGAPGAPQGDPSQNALAQIIQHLTQQTSDAAQAPAMPQPMSPNGVMQPDFSDNPILAARRGFGFGRGY